MNWIYFIRSEHTGRIKIGISVDVENRFREHQADTGDVLTLLGKIAGSVQLEGAIHLAFKHCRVRQEWFAPEPELLLYIERRLAVFPEPIPSKNGKGELVAGAEDALLPRRRGQPWEDWEEQLLLDDHLTPKMIAARIARTPHSISERRRWLIRHRAMLRKVMV